MNERLSADGQAIFSLPPPPRRNGNRWSVDYRHRSNRRRVYLGRVISRPLLLLLLRRRLLLTIGFVTPLFSEPIARRYFDVATVEESNEKELKY